MLFKVLPARTNPSSVSHNTAYLITDNWDDWFEFITQYYLFYVDDEGERHEIGNVKIGRFNMEKDQKRVILPPEFETLNDLFFSLGQDDTYYEHLKNLDEEISSNILASLKDIALDTELFERALNERVTKISLLREVPIATVKGQFRRLANRLAKLTEYQFNYIAPKIRNSTEPPVELNFHVIPNSNPPTNINVLIGRNGVGKTHLLNNMLESLLSTEKLTKYGTFDSEDEILFANIVFVTFSAFDESEPKKEVKDKTKNIDYSYIGLKRIRKENEPNLPPKSPVMLKNEFVKSFEKCRQSVKKTRWKRAIQILQSDPMFRESGILDTIDIPDVERFKEEASEIFKKLSSGHKIILLTITRLVETVKERTLILLDEPEAHLHPPLLSAFIRALSDLLIQRNGVAIIATHSPVILQEVPKSCVWTLRRTGINTIVDQLNNESFGENVGVLTQEVFGLEVSQSGFHSLLEKSVKKNDDYSAILEDFGNQLGMESRAIARVLISLKNKDER